MPPSNKGMKKKSDRKDTSRPPRSRNTTPSAGAPATSTPRETALLNARIKPLVGHNFEELTDGASPAIPDSKSLRDVAEQLRNLSEAVEANALELDSGMRKLAALRKEKARETEEEKLAEDKKLRDDAADKLKRGVKRKEMAGSKDRPLTHGAHGVAAQDGSTELSASRRDSASSSLSPPAGPATPDAGNSVSNTAIVDDDDDSSDERQPAPAPSIPQVAYFGSDPTSFDDPVDYELRKVEPWMTPDEIRKVCSVADYPKKDLADLGPGTPPDKDYSNAKPTNQVQASTFQTAIEPYLQPLHEGDLAWLRARGDKVSPYVIPRHGEHYKIQWAREDGLSEPNIGKDDDDAYSGNLEVLPAEAAEAENFNVGPGGLASRLLQAMRPEYRAAAMDASTDNMADISMGGDVNGNNDDLNDILDGGDMSMGVGMGMTNGNGFGGSMSGGVGFDDSMGMGATSFPPATQMPGSNTESWKKLNQPTMDKDQFEEGVRQQLIHAGFLEPNTQKPDYDGQFDNPVAARLRELHAQLAVKSKENYAKKLRLLDLSKDHMAKQEFDTVSIDLDSQLNSNFQKRTRTMGKKGKAKRPHASVGNAVNPAGQAKPALGDQTKILMDRRKRWTATVGQVFEDPKQFNVPRASDPDSSIFKDEDMAPYRAAAAAHFENDEPEADE